MGTFVWWEGLTTGRGEWRYSGMETGEPSVTLCGVQLMLMLFADNYNTQLKTVTIYDTYVYSPHHGFCTFQVERHVLLCHQVHQSPAAASMELVWEIYILVVLHAMAMRAEFQNAAITLMKLQIINMMYKYNVNKVY